MLDLQATLDRHGLRHRGAAPGFFQGALLGNGGLGVAVTTRPDAVMFHLGHNEVWDERIDESHAEHTLDFETVWQRIQAAAAGDRVPEADPWVRDYVARMEAPYLQPYPRPYPCGSVVLSWDPNRGHLVGHHLDIADGTIRVTVRAEGVAVVLAAIVDQQSDRLHIWAETPTGAATDFPAATIRLVPHSPPAEGETVAEQAVAATDAFRDRSRAGLTLRVDSLRPDAFGYLDTVPTASDPKHILAVTASCDTALASPPPRRRWSGAAEADCWERTLAPGSRSLTITLDSSRGEPAALPAAAQTADTEQARAASARFWHDFWRMSMVAIDVPELERAWYRSTYHLACALRGGRTAPGLFGNWSLRDIGTAWHGDYHFNYNTQQVYWGVFSSNRAALHEPYLDLVDSLLPIAQNWAREYYHLGGAAFPHSSYPVPLTAMPYAAPVWGWEMCETPWVVQSLIWHYRYTRDPKVRERIITPIRESVRFILGYLSRDDAEGPDGIRSFWPTVVPEVFGLSRGLRYNRDCIVDIELTRFLFEAFLELSGPDDDLVTPVRETLARLAPAPTSGVGAEQVFVATPDAPADVVMNIPLHGVPVFPAERIHLESAPDQLELARRSIRSQQVEGGNELVFLALQQARVGELDLQAFANKLAYCERENGTYANMVLQTHGRYDDTIPFDFMAHMGVWVENFSVTGVVNEVLLQAPGGIVHVFPGLRPDQDACFERLRIPGAHLVSATQQAGRVSEIVIESDHGGQLSVALPWAAAQLHRGTQKESIASRVPFRLSAGETVRLTPR